MNFWEELKNWWPIAVTLAAIGIRVEVGQALNRQSIKNLQNQRNEDRDDTREMLKEIRTDIKTLLQSGDAK